MVCGDKFRAEVEASVSDEGEPRRGKPWRYSRRIVSDTQSAKRYRLAPFGHDVSKRLKPPLKAILSWYEGADNRCRHEIFGDIFLLAFFVCVGRANEDFPAHDAEQAFLPGVEHARP